MLPPFTPSPHPSSPKYIQSQITPQDASHFRVARVYGCDRNISFNLFREYFEFPVVQRLFQTKSWGILQYQFIRRHHEVDTQEMSVVLEIRLLRDPGTGKISDLELAREIKIFFKAFKCKEELLDSSGFMHSKTGRKVMNFVDLTMR
jgi:hypothetical protein